MQSAEIELKIPLADPVRFQAALPAAGFYLETSRTFEVNTLYDTPSRTLRQASQILRLRQYGSLWTLTHKRHPDLEDLSSRYKVRIETETRLDDGPALQEILSRLGYTAVFRYEKYRTEWTQLTSDAGGHLVIDETPIGTWAELEGPTAWIDAALSTLAIDAGTSTTDSYGKLFLTWKQHTGSLAEHLTFADIPQPAQPPPA